MKGPSRLPGALVVSLDFELRWGIREGTRAEDQVDRLLGAREAVARMLELFEEHEIAATWAIVGLLFARSARDAATFAPESRPAYANPSLCPYEEPIGESESEDPLRLAPSLVRRIREGPRQEVGTHTFSHYYCGEEGASRESLRADLAAAAAIAARDGLRLRSIVFPRNQHVPDHDEVLLESGIRSYRGNPGGAMWRFGDARESASPAKRAARLADAYFGGGGRALQRWDEVRRPNGMSDVRASAFLRPFHPALRPLESLRLARIRRSLRAAARKGRIYHLWWHPHNFGTYTEENLAFLRKVLGEYRRCRAEHGMLSLTMADVDDRVRSAFEAPGDAVANPAGGVG